MRRRLVTIGLGLACVVPVLGAAYRGAQLLDAGDWRLAFAPDHADALPLLVHVVSAALFYPLAALQLLPGFRARHPRWHRRAGGVAIVAGLIGAASGTWISAAHIELSGPVLMYGRLVFGPLWGLFLVLGVVALARRDFAGHGAWMLRAFAVAMPAGTLVFIFTPFWLALGEVPQQLDETIQSCAWVAHLAVAELLIRRARRASSHPTTHRTRDGIALAPRGVPAARH